MPVDYFILLAVLIPFHCDLQKTIKSDCPKQPFSVTLCELLMEELTFEVTKVTGGGTVPVQPIFFVHFACHEIGLAFQAPSLWYPAERPISG